MSKNVSIYVPVAERIVEFNEGNFSEDLVTNPLVIVDGKDILQYASEYPIVVYKCNEKENNGTIIPEPRLNGFILNIVVSTGLDGKRYSLSSGKIEEEPAEFDTIAYYEDHFGIKHQILQYDICQFLLKKPKLVISEEGVLIFYTGDEILATIDCEHYIWIEIVEDYNTIEEITACKEFCNVILVKDKDITNEYGNTLKEANRKVLTLKFKFKMAAADIIEAVLSSKN